LTAKYSSDRIEIPQRIPSHSPKEITAAQLGVVKARET
jgi:hypothetical protein